MSEDPIAFLTSIRRDQTYAERGQLWPLILIALVLLAVAVGFFGRTNGGTAIISPTVSEDPGRQVRTYTVSYRFGVFSPTNLRIHMGDTVKFRNDSSLPIKVVAELQPGSHTPPFDSIGDIKPDEIFSYTFASTGIFGYYNDKNGSETGSIIVR